MSSPLSDTYPVAGYMSQLSHTSIPPLQQNDDNMLPALRGGTDCLTLTVGGGRGTGYLTLTYYEKLNGVCLKE